MKRIVLIAVLVLVGCVKASNADTVNKFFAGHKIGNSPDYAIMQDGSHVITIHGYLDDLSMCLTIVEQLKADSPLADFSCIPLNH
jgi:hypothetical protein